MRQGSTLALVALIWFLLLVAPALIKQAQADGGSAPVGGWVLPDAMQGRRVPPIFLLSRPDVQADLGMKPDQVADAGRVIADLYRKAAALQGRKDQAAIEQRRVVDEEQRLWLETRLTEDQVGRLTEIDLRWEGVAAIITRPTLAETLSLSDDQRAALTRLATERNARHARPAERDPTAADRHFVQQVWATLSDGQRKRWERMIGRTFAITTTAATGGRTVR